MNGVYSSVEMGPVGGALPNRPPHAVELSDLGVHATFDDGAVELANVWLRDNCPCDTCRITQTDERRLQPWKHAVPTAIGAGVTDGELTVDWADGHRSNYPAQWWEATNRRARRGAHTVRLWRDGYDLSRFAHDDVLGSLDVRQAMFHDFVRDGAVVVNHAPTVPGTVVEFMRAINLTLIDSNLGFIFDVKLDPAGYNVAFTSEELPLHNDNAQYLQPPSGQVLSMLVNEASGGESMVADGWCVLEQLRAQNPTAVDVLASVDVGFRQYSTKSDGFGRSPLVVRDAHGRFTHLRFSNQLMQPLAWDHPRLAEWYAAYRELGELLHAPGNHIEFRLHGGEMLMVNGYRILHARKAFKADGPRHLQDVYFSSQDVVDHLSRMSGEVENAMAGAASAH